MSDTEFEKQDWVELLRQTGLDDDAMQRWHALFEKGWPDAHQSFLEWLRIPGTEIDRIRASSRGVWAKG